VDGILDGTRFKIAAWSNQLENIRLAKEAKATESITKAAQSAEYFRKKKDLESLQRFRDALSIKLAQEKVDMAIPKSIMVTITDYPQVAKQPVKPNKPMAILLGVVIGLVVGVGLAFFIEYLDTSVKTIDEVEHSLQAPVLGVIPQNVGYLIKEGAESPHAEAYRVLRTNLLFSRKDEKLTSIVVVSAGAGEGKSTTVFNLATIFAMHGNRVIIVDSDLRRPTIHKILSVSNSIGLTNYLLKQNTLEEVIQTTSLPTLDVLPSGKLPSSSMGILNSKAMRDLVAELKQRYDFVFFDSPPMVGLSDASILCSEMDLSIQVIQYRRYPQPMTIRAKQMIEKVGGRVAGIVLNNINMSQDEYYYYYSGYYGGYYGDYYSKRDDEKGGEGDEPGKKGKVEIKQKY
jgi:capsular exopolysaccharide synthesis family protein